MVEETALDAIFGALAHPQRRKVAAFVFRNGPVPFAKIVERMQLSQSLASKHLYSLRKADLISCEKQGGLLTCRKAEGGLALLNGWFARVMGTAPAGEAQSASLDRLYRLLSDAGRRRLLEEASLAPGRTVGVLAACSELTPETASRKLKALGAAGCVRTERRGRETLCRLNPPAFLDAWHWPNYVSTGGSPGGR